MKVVVFSYEIGSFGKPIAIDLAQNTDLDYIPFSHIYQSAIERNAKFRRYKEEQTEAKSLVDIWEGHFFVHPSFISLFESIVLELAARGNVIMVGSSIQSFLRSFTGVAFVHVHAPVDVRVRRFMDFNRMSFSESNQTVKWWDQRRRALFEISSIFQNSDKIDAYDLIINTDRVSIPSASHLLKCMLRELPSPPDSTAWKERLLKLALAKRVECAVRENGSSLGLAPLEVIADGNDTLKLTGFVNCDEAAEEALNLARKASEGKNVISMLKVLQIHNDLLPPHQWRS